MKIGKAGLDLIYEFEGKLTRLSDGRYQAYRCPAGVWTIYAGCTEGVLAGMIVTEDEGEAMFRLEIAKFERCVALACTREPNQNQYDAFVAFSYNVGEAGFRKSSVLRFFNSGQDEKAAAAFALWNRAGGRALRGLVRRRAAETGLFMRPVQPQTVPEMPQKIDPPGMSDTAKTGTAAGVLTGGGVLLSDPAGLTSTLVAVKSNAGQLLTGVSLTGLLVPLVILAAVLGVIWYARQQHG